MVCRTGVGACDDRLTFRELDEKHLLDHRRKIGGVEAILLRVPAKQALRVRRRFRSPLFLPLVVRSKVVFPAPKRGSTPIRYNTTTYLFIDWSFLWNDSR
jgi:hypothetical protein